MLRCTNECAWLYASIRLPPSAPAEDRYPLTRQAYATSSTASSRRGLIFSESPSSLQNLIWEWHLGALIPPPPHPSSHPASIAPVLQDSNHCTFSWPTASNRWPYDPARLLPPDDPCYLSHHRPEAPPLSCYRLLAKSNLDLLTYRFSFCPHPQKKVPPPFFGK